MIVVEVLLTSALVFAAASMLLWFTARYERRIGWMPVRGSSTDPVTPSRPQPPSVRLGQPARSGPWPLVPGSDQGEAGIDARVKTGSEASDQGGDRPCVLQ